MASENTNPSVTVLIPTFNREHLLPRAVNSVLAQDFSDFEIIILDDASSDATPDVVRAFQDPRIRYIRNEINQGAKHGDRAHVRRTLYELMRGRYFVCLCDDDFWLPKDLLRRQVEAFKRYPSLAIALGGHAHIQTHKIEKRESGEYLTYEQVPEVSETTYHAHNLFPSGFMTRQQYLDLFAEDPLPRNVLNGATLLSREAVIRAQAFHSEKGARWQGGFEFTIGPAMVGDVFYIDEPCVIAAVDPNSASFRGSQRMHFLDCLASIETASANVYPALSASDQAMLDRIKKKFIHQVTMGFLVNRIAFKLGWYARTSVNPVQMFRENVTVALALATFRRNRITPTIGNVCTMVLSTLPASVLRAGSAALMLWERTLGRVLPIKRLVQRGLRSLPNGL